MKSTIRALPPLTTLKAFEAAARLQSFTRAANEICVTQGAISRHIKTLEDNLGTKLFERDHRNVRLTADGRKLRDAVSMGLTQISTAAREIRQQTESGRLTVGLTGPFANLFMAYRIASFQQANPSIDVHVVALERTPNPARDQFDVSICMGHQATPEFHQELLFTEEVFPVCSPGYLEGMLKPVSVQQLADERLLHMDEEYWSGYSWTPIDWTNWMVQFGVNAMFENKGLLFNNYPMMIQTALKGHGIGLGWRHLISDFLDDGSLVRPVAQSYKLDRGHHMVIAESVMPRPGVSLFRRWLMDQTAAFRE